MSKRTLAEEQEDLRLSLVDLGQKLRATIPTWLPRHAWWIQSVCGVALLGFSGYMLYIGEPIGAAMLAAFVVWASLRSIRRGST